MTRRLGSLGSVLIAATLLTSCGAEAGAGSLPEWSGPTKVPGVGSLSAVSCPTTDFCMAVGDGDAVRYLDGHWLAPTALDMRGPAADGLVTVSCSSTSFCVAGDGRGQVFTYAGSRWSGPGRVAKAGLAQLSCGARSFCAALDTNGAALVFDGSAWSPPQPISDSAQPVAIACTQGSFCMAVDGGAQGTYRLARGSWTASGELDVSTPQGGSEPNAGSAVSCATTTFCAALDNFGEAFTWVAGRWSGASQFDPNLMDGSDAVSCPSSGFCMVIDGDGMTTTWTGERGRRPAGSTAWRRGWPTCRARRLDSASPSMTAAAR